MTNTSVKNSGSFHHISIIVPVKDESPNILELAEEIRDAMSAQSLPWDVLWVDDGSTDNTLALLKGLNAKDPRHRFLSFQQNCGQSAALVAGFNACEGDVIATLDGDRQNDPGDIPRLVAHLQAGDADMVNGYRAERRDSLVRKIASRIANGFRNMTTGKTVRDVGCSTRVFKRECIKDLPRFKGLHRFLPTLIALKGYRLTEVPVNHRPRGKGTTKYTINNRLWVGIYDIFGVMWLRRRTFAYQIKEKSD